MTARKVDTMPVKGGEYARVPARLKLFREDTSNGSIKTTYEIEGDIVVFTAHIVKDKRDSESAEATGHAYGALGKIKEFEKLETTAVGRALALLGYLASGEVASFEEIEEFEREKKEKIEVAVRETLEAMENAHDVTELTKIAVDSQLLYVPEIIEMGKKKKAELIDNKKGKE